MTNKFSRPLGASFNAREADPPTPAPAPTEAKPNEGGPQQTRYARFGHELQPSAGRLLPAFTRFGESLKAELAADAAIREGKVKEHFGPTPAERLQLHKQLLAEQVKAGDLTNSEANVLFAEAHPGIDPATLQPRKS